MTLRLFDGFDAYLNGGPATWNNQLGAAWTSGGNHSGGAASRFGRGAAASGSFGSEDACDHGNHDAQVIFGMALNDHDGGSGGSTPNKLVLVRFYDGATKQATVTMETDGSIALRRGDESGTIVTGGQTAAGIFNHNPTFFDGYAVRVKFSATVGEFQVWKNGASVFNSASNLNTIATANAYSTKFATVGIGSYHTYMDDAYYIVVDGTPPNSFPGDTTAYTLFPSGAGASTQWTPDSGSNYARVNEANGVEDGNYVADSTVGHIDEYTLDDLPAGFLGTIISAQYNLRGRKDDATTRQIALRVNSGGTIAHGTTMTCASTYQTQRDQALVDPNTSAAWTASAINALKIGPEVIT